MLESLVFTLLQTLAGFLFEQELQRQVDVQIDGAPGWYYELEDDYLCGFGHARGGLDSVKQAKRNASADLRENLDRLLTKVVAKKVDDLRDEKEKRLVFAFKTDERVDLFVETRADYRRIKYEKDIKTSFVQACIPDQVVYDYQKQRLEDIRIAISHKRRDDAFGEMNESMQ